MNLTVQARRSWWLSLLVLIAGGCASWYLIKTPRAAMVRDLGPPPLVVDTVTAERSSYQVWLPTHGRVSASARIELVARAAGEVRWVSPDFAPGRRFANGDLLLQLDDRAAQIEQRAAAADLQAAEALFAQEQGLAEQAEREWRSLKGRRKASPLLRREPQMQAARAAIQAARARVDRAALQLEQTRIHAPWDGELIVPPPQIGQFLGAGTPIGAIHRLDRLRLRVPLTDHQIVQLPAANGAKARITPAVPGDERQWFGRVLRLEGHVNPLSRQRHALVTLWGERSALPPVGAFVQVRIKGQRFEDVVRLPAGAVSIADEVHWLRDGVVEAVPVRVLHREGGSVVVAGELPAGAQILERALLQVPTGRAVVAARDTAVPTHLSELRTEDR